MRLTDEQIQKALKNANILLGLIKSGNIAGNAKEANEGRRVQIFGEANTPQLIMILEDLIYYKSQVEEMQKTLEAAEYNFQWIHNKFGSGEISAQDVLNKSAEFRREVDKTLQSLKGDKP